MSRTMRRGTALVAGAALALTALAGSPAQAAAGEAKPAATWLSGQLTGGLIHNDQHDSNNYGLSIDTALALDAIGVRDAAVQSVATAIATNKDAYTGTPDVYAGAAAKALTLLQVAQGSADPDPALRNVVAGQVIASGPSAGRIQDTSSWGDYANTIGQAFAARSLSAADPAVAPPVVQFLLAQQCDAGYFRLNFNTDKEAAEQGCVDGAPGSESDTDVTALVLLQLEASEAAAEPDVAAALENGAAWLAAQQKADGSFGGGTSTAASNANSTGLAGWALAEVGRTAKARKAATWVRALQPADLGACRSKLTRDAGAIAYDETALKAGRKDGITVESQDQWRRATAQAAPVLTYLPKGKKLTVAAKKVVKRGAKVTLTIKGLDRNENACISLGAKSKRVVGTGTTVKVAFQAPAKRRVLKAIAQTLDSKAVRRVWVVR